VEPGLAFQVQALTGSVADRAGRFTPSMDVGTKGRLPEPVEVAAYYAVSEALTNAAKHAHATSVTVKVDVVSDVLRLGIHDDGVGGARTSTAARACSASRTGSTPWAA
jgi:signal transduction histidine kinase